MAANAGEGERCRPVSSRRSRLNAASAQQRARQQRWAALLALQPGTASAGCGGRPFPSSAPRPPGTGTVLALQPQTPRGLRWLRAVPALPLPPGAPRSQNPSPARRGKSVAAGRALSVQATLAALGAGAALTAPAQPLALWPPPGRKTGWGKGLGGHRWRSRWSRRGSLLQWPPAAC